jgi:hypothetical protein
MDVVEEKKIPPPSWNLTQDHIQVVKIEKLEVCYNVYILHIYIVTLFLFQWVLGDISLGVKWLGCEADHSPPPSAKVKNGWGYTSTSPVHCHIMVLS